MPRKLVRYATILLGTAIFCRVLLTVPTDGHAGRGALPRPGGVSSATLSTVVEGPRRNLSAASMAPVRPSGISRSPAGPRPMAETSASAEAISFVKRSFALAAAAADRAPYSVMFMQTAWADSFLPLEWPPEAILPEPESAATRLAAARLAVHETLPLTGPIPVPGDPALTAKIAANWRDAPAPLPVAGPVRPGIRYDTQGAYREEVALVTAYCPCTRCCGQLARGITSTGKSAWSRGLAADPRRLEYGTKVYVPDYGVAVIDDTGGAMRQSWRRHGRLHLDIRLDNHRDARVWGRRNLMVRVYE